MSILVTGSNGFLGAVLVEKLVARGHRGVRCLVRSGSNLSRLDAVRDRHPDADLQLVQGSLSSVEGARAALEGVTTLYHLAASLSGAPADMFLNTVVTSKNVAEAVIELDSPPRVVLVSSFGVYGVGDLPRGSVVNENTPLEHAPEARDLYSQAKLRQEQLFWEYREKKEFPLVVLRPGAIYGPGGGVFSARVGVQLPGVFLFLGRNNLLPLSFVDNCAESLAVAGESSESDGQIYNVVDDDLPTCRQYLQRYKREVGPIRSLPVPYPLLMLGSHLVKRYHDYSKGQLPAIFTPYKTATTWKGNRFDNSKMKSLGWAQSVSTEQALRRTFEAIRGKQRAA